MTTASSKRGGSVQARCWLSTWNGTRSCMTRTSSVSWARASLGSHGSGSRVWGQRSVPVLQRALGYSNEDVKIVLRTMGAEAQDAVWSMGDDTPIAPFARVPRPIYTFFRQRFAQVTNPPIDPLRESLVMSLRTWLGPQPDLLRLEGEHGDLIELDSPI